VEGDRSKVKEVESGNQSDESVVSGYCYPDANSLCINRKHRDYKVPMQQGWYKKGGSEKMEG
jgi:hypothetical protein